MIFNSRSNITDQGKYSYTIPACPKGGQTDISQTYVDMPFDQKIVIPQKCKYIICYDNTFSGAAEQIRFVNWQGKKVYLSQNYSGFCLDVSCLTNSDLNDILNVLQEEINSREVLPIC